MNELLANILANTHRAVPAAQAIHAGARSIMTQLEQVVDMRSAAVAAQTMEAGPQSHMERNTQIVNVNVAEKVYYFDIALLADDGTVLTEFCGGRTYTVRISASLNPGGNGKQQPVMMQRQLAFFLEAGSIAPMQSDIHFMLDADEQWYLDFPLIIPSDYAEDTITLELHYREAQSQNNLRIATSLQITVVGPRGVSQQQHPAHVMVAATAEILSNTAVLHIYPADQRQLRLMGFVHDHVNRPLSLDPIDPLHTLPVDHDDATYLEEMGHAVFDFGMENPGNVIVWFEDVLQLYGNETYIQICDHADSCIPWEMVKLSNKKYLSAQALMVRIAEPASYRMPHTFADLQGRVAAYIDPEDHANTTQHCPILQQLVPKPVTSPDDMQYELYVEEGVTPISLVYLGYDGLLVYGDEQDILEELKKNWKSVRVRFDDYQGEPALRPLFFVNAHYSGRIFRRGKTACGFARAVLTQVGTGYIGTLGPVERICAVQMAHQFLTHALQERVEPARLLRTLRQEAAQVLNQLHKLPATQRKEARRRALSTFLYVYYGDPQISLRLEAQYA